MDCLSPAAEIENLKKEATAFRAVRRAMGDEGGAKAVFEKVGTVLSSTQNAAERHF